METGLRYNYFRNSDFQTGRYIESDSTGLRASLNTFAYANDRPTSAIDPRGLLSLTVATSWSTVESIDGSLATTNVDPPHPHCVCEGCGGQWKLSECTAFLYIQVTMQSHYSTPQKEAFAHHGEEEHVQDWKNGAAEMRRRGEVAERVQKQNVLEQSNLRERGRGSGWSGNL